MRVLPGKACKKLKLSANNWNICNVCKNHFHLKRIEFKEREMQILI